MTRGERIASQLDRLLEACPDVEAAAVVSVDGLPMASALPPHVEEDRLAAMSAALLSLGERAASELGKGELAQVFVRGALGHVVIIAAGAAAVLVAITSGESKIGLVLFEMRRTAGQIAAVLDEPATPPPPIPDEAPAAHHPSETATPWH